MVEERHLEYERDNNTCPTGYFVCCECETKDMALRNNLNKQDIIPSDKFKELIQKVIHYNIHDPSFKNLSVCGICHFQYPDQSIYELI